MLERAYVLFRALRAGRCGNGGTFYGATICAERTAMVKAVSEGHRLPDLILAARITDSMEFSAVI